MAGTTREVSKLATPRWYAPTPAKFLFAVLVMQGVLFLSAHYRWFWFNERKGYTVLITVAATALALLLLSGFVFASRFFKSRTQFSLATLLLVVPVMAIPCGWLTRDLEQARQQQDLLALADEDRTDATGVPQNWFTETLGADFFSDVTYLGLSGDAISDAEMLKLQGFTQLQELSLSQTQVTNGGLAHLKDLASLRGLLLRESQIGDDGLAHLKELTQLQFLWLIETQVTDAGLEHLQGFTALQLLNLDGTQITGAGLKHLKGLTQLQTLSLRRTQVNDAGLEPIQELTQLRVLDLFGTQVTDDGMVHLEGLTQLKNLRLGKTQVTYTRERRLLKNLPNCPINW
jgi:Leucine-rich repeat (LRR) protein